MGAGRGWAGSRSRSRCTRCTVASEDRTASTPSYSLTRSPIRYTTRSDANRTYCTVHPALLSRSPAAENLGQRARLALQTTPLTRRPSYDVSCRTSSPRSPLGIASSHPTRFGLCPRHMYTVDCKQHAQPAHAASCQAVLDHGQRGCSGYQGHNGALAWPRQA